MSDGIHPGPGGAGRPVDRRSLLVRGGLTAMAAMAATVAGASSGFVERLLRERFTELSDERKQEILRALELDYERRYGRAVTVDDTQPLGGVEFGYGLDFSDAGQLEDLTISWEALADHLAALRRVGRRHGGDSDLVSQRRRSGRTAMGGPDRGHDLARRPVRVDHWMG